MIASKSDCSNGRVRLDVSASGKCLLAEEENGVAEDENSAVEDETIRLDKEEALGLTFFTTMVMRSSQRLSSLDGSLAAIVIRIAPE